MIFRRRRLAVLFGSPPRNNNRPSPSHSGISFKSALTFVAPHARPASRPIRPAGLRAAVLHRLARGAHAAHEVASPSPFFATRIVVIPFGISDTKSCPSDPSPDSETGSHWSLNGARQNALGQAQRKSQAIHTKVWSSLSLPLLPPSLRPCGPYVRSMVSRRCALLVLGPMNSIVDDDEPVQVRRIDA